MPSCGLFQVASISVCVHRAFISHSRSSVMKQYLDNKTHLKAQNHHSKSRLIQLLISILPTNTLALMCYFCPWTVPALCKGFPDSCLEREIRQFTGLPRVPVVKQVSWRYHNNTELPYCLTLHTASEYSWKTTWHPQELSWVTIPLLGASWLHRWLLRT